MSRLALPAPEPSPKPADANIRRLKAEYLKKRGDAALQEGNFREAADRYTEAIATKPDREGLQFLYGNRCLAHLRAQKYGPALQDADAAASLAPRWDKAHWRRGAALLGLRDVPGAVYAFLEAWRLTKGDEACRKKLWEAVQRLTREQLGAAILRLVADLQGRSSCGWKALALNPCYVYGLDGEQGQVEPPRREAASEAEQAEAWFRILAAAHKGAPKPGPYYVSLLGWLTRGLDAPTAYTERAAMHVHAKCYLQAREDAAAAVALLIASLAGQRELPPGQLVALGRAYLWLGRGCMAEPGHEDRDATEALKAFVKGADVDPECKDLAEGVQQASEHLTKERLAQALGEAFDEGSTGAGRGLRHPSAAGFADGAAPGQRLFRAELRLAFPGASQRGLSAAARKLLRASLAAAAGVDPLRATLERVRAPGADMPYLAVEVHVQVGAELLAGQRLVDAVQDAAALPGVLGGDALAAMLGPPDAAACTAELVDMTPKCALTEAEAAELRAAGEEGAGPASAEQDRRLAVPSRPKLELELPYRMYRLTRADGAPLERLDKHPFAMSRVYYDASEKPEEVWAEMADGSCRWRQTGSEVKVLALKVPQGVPPRELAVTIEPFRLRVAHKGSGEVYLEGELERGIVPEDSYWTHCQGEAEDGCVISLHKMNLELLQKPWLHSEMWWPRLFAHHGEIAWDDYEKDYSDLPQPVMQRHRIAEAIKDTTQRLEAAEKTYREALQERNDLRKRTRQERLHQLRTGRQHSWVQLHRGEHWRRPAPRPAQAEAAAQPPTAAADAASAAAPAMQAC